MDEDPALIRQWLQQEDDRIDRVVRQHGWAVEYVIGEPGEREPPFAYTIGLTGLDHDELIIFGVSAETAGAALNTLGERIRGGSRIVPGELQTFEQWPHRLHALELPNPEDLLLAACRYYQHPVAALQLVWDDKWGHFPWEPSYDPPGWLQPLPGTATA